MATYAEKLRDPRWFAKRQEILERDKRLCRYCQTGEEPDGGFDKLDLQVHHLRYKKGMEPWEYDNSLLLSLCDTCHNNITGDIEDISELLVRIQQLQPWMLQHARAALKRIIGEIEFDMHPPEFKRMMQEIFEEQDNG